ncbi:type I-C CRISPR-associated protein Cas5c [Xanthomonas citri]|uniref:type I-C CRISPR-associated protein Cas5c n=2 Tax=Xanthomonas citri TaxID=346 RepID=UPI000348C95D
MKLHVWGERALFTRPEMKVERVSYDIITPSAARGILEAIHWKPAIRWMVDSIQVLKPIRFESIRRNEVGGKLSAASVSKAIKAGRTDTLVSYVEEDRQQRAATLLRDVGYVIAAHFELTRRAPTTTSASTWTSSTAVRGAGSASRPRAWARANSRPASR